MQPFRVEVTAPGELFRMEILVQGLIHLNNSHRRIGDIDCNKFFTSAKIGVQEIFHPSLGSPIHAIMGPLTNRPGMVRSLHIFTPLSHRA